MKILCAATETQQLTLILNLTQPNEYLKKKKDQQFWIAWCVFQDGTNK